MTGDVSQELVSLFRAFEKHLEHFGQRGDERDLAREGLVKPLDRVLRARGDADEESALVGPLESALFFLEGRVHESVAVLEIQILEGAQNDFVRANLVRGEAGTLNR